MDMVSLDFETYYAKDFTLSKMTTEEYVRDPRFQIIGVGVQFNDNAPRWFSGAGVAEVIRIIPWSKVALLCHNTNFDGFILKEKFGVVPRFYFDTLSMARPWHGYNVGGSLKKLSEHYGIGEKGTEVIDALGKRLEDFNERDLQAYGGYCMNDVTLTRKLFQILKAKTPMMELLLIDRTVRMFCDAKLLLDPVLVQEEIDHEVTRKQELMDQVEHIAPKEVLMSNPQFATLLESLGVDVPMKVSARTGKETYAFGKTDKAFTALLEYDDPRGCAENAELVQALVAARLGVKSTIGETRSRRLLGIANRGPLPVDLQYCGALVTQRWSGGSKINLQNLNRGGRLRRSIMAPAGYSIVAVDSSNIELRVAHCLAEQQSTVESLRVGRDLYCEFASVLFDRPITKADKNERQLGKLAMLSLQYGAGAPKFREMCRLNGITLTEEEAKRIVTLWRETYHRIPALWRACDKSLEYIVAGNRFWVDNQMLVQTCPEGLVTKPNNQILYPSLQKDSEGKWFYLARNNERKKMWGGTMVENICQHLARNIIAEQLLRISAKYPVVLTVHDEVVYLAPEDEAEDAMQFGVAEMSKSPTWWPAIPLAAEGEHGARYS